MDWTRIHNPGSFRVLQASNPIARDLRSARVQPAARQGSRRPVTSQRLEQAPASCILQQSRMPGSPGKQSLLDTGGPERRGLDPVDSKRGFPSLTVTPTVLNSKRRSWDSESGREACQVSTKPWVELRQGGPQPAQIPMITFAKAARRGDEAANIRGTASGASGGAILPVPTVGV